ncbi:Two-component response regulator ARR2 [Apostasia shenzhenica]|uniref:Two-component response regulator ARR2 n=1 Tax=Apostasia shenzhenica TaxID=1088818 RepID=A0A2I0AQR4_9ASPA|nr:Two-component response regulator ARR2 [Apostasia shenzhenica]
MSSDFRTDIVMEGIKHGACDYLIKPVREEELQNVWQHIIRRKFCDGIRMETLNGPERDDRSKQTSEHGKDALPMGTGSTADSKNKKKRSFKQFNAREKKEGGFAPKKPRVVWATDLHQNFVAAVNHLGIDKAVPKKVLDLMNVPGLTRENVASHLQKFRQFLKKLIGVDMNRNGHPEANDDARLCFQGFIITEEIAQEALAAIQNGFINERPTSLEKLTSTKSVIQPESLEGSGSSVGVKGFPGFSGSEPLPKPIVSDNVPFCLVDNAKALVTASERNPIRSHPVTDFHWNNTYYLNQKPISVSLQPSICLQTEDNQLQLNFGTMSTLDRQTSSCPVSVDFHGGNQFSSSNNTEVIPSQQLTSQQSRPHTANFTAVDTPPPSSTCPQQMNESFDINASQHVTMNEGLLPPSTANLQYLMMQELDEQSGNVNINHFPDSISSLQSSTGNLNECHLIHGYEGKEEMQSNLMEELNISFVGESLTIANQFTGKSSQNQPCFWSPGIVDEREVEHDNFYLNLICSPKAEDSVLELLIIPQ